MTLARRTNRIGGINAGAGNALPRAFAVKNRQLPRNTDRRSEHRDAQLALAITLILTVKLIDWRHRYSPIR